MFDENKKKIIIIAVIILIIILIFLIIWFLLPKKSAENVNVAVNANIRVSQTANNEIAKLPPPNQAKIQEENNYTLGLKQLALSFAERFGSYSNHSGSAGLESLFPLVTAKMQSAINKIITNNSYSTSTYEGFNTKALTGDLLNIDQQKASILVYTQRTYRLADKTPKVFYQNLSLKFLKIGNEWKIDEAVWR
ncbi:hypothetical protein HZA71_01455 [Candidatus Falkowbacteria bacterium]|nr:hypothetical protein [Candidatus Falkowbacteria bacterium]